MSSSATATKTQPQSTTDDAADTESVKKCLLCGDTERQKSQYGTWEGLVRTYLEHHLGNSPTDNSYLCKKHLLEDMVMIKIMYHHGKNACLTLL